MKVRQWLTREGLSRLTEMAAKAESDAALAKEMEIAEGTLKEWRRRFPDIARAASRKVSETPSEARVASLERPDGGASTSSVLSEHADCNPPNQGKMRERSTGGACKQGETRERSNDGARKQGESIGCTDVEERARGAFTSETPENDWSDVEEALHKLALGYTMDVEKPFKRKQIEYDPTTGKKASETEEMTTCIEQIYVSPNVTAQRYWLSNRCPQRWRDRPLSEDREEIGKLDRLLSGMDSAAQEGKEEP